MAARPDDPEALNNLGQTLVRLNRAQEAIPQLRVGSAARSGEMGLSVQSRPGARPHRRLGRRGRRLSCCRSAVSGRPRHALQSCPGPAEGGTGGRGAPILERVMALAPEDPSFVLTAARTYDELDRREEAVGELQEIPEPVRDGSGCGRCARPSGSRSNRPVNRHPNVRPGRGRDTERRTMRTLRVSFVLSCFWHWRRRSAPSRSPTCRAARGRGGSRSRSRRASSPTRTCGRSEAPPPPPPPPPPAAQASGHGPGGRHAGGA